MRLATDQMESRCGSCGRQLPSSRAYCSSRCRKEMGPLRLQLKYLGSSLDRIKSKTSFLQITASEIYLFAKVGAKFSCHKHVRNSLRVSDSIRDIWLLLNKSSTRAPAGLFFNDEAQLPKGFLNLMRNRQGAIPAKEPRWNLLEINPREWETNSVNSIDRAYRRMAKLANPDKDGNNELFVSISAARDAAKKFLMFQMADKPKRATSCTWKYWKDIGWWTR